ncbi:MAG: carbon starvation protein A [Haloglomus sp.]
MVQVIWLVLLVLALFTVGYLGYSKYLAQFVELDEDRETPAHKYEDGQEYVPAKKPVLLGHHYSSIAGGAPIVGPITAGVVWGWVPALLWVAIGNPLMGSVHDFVSLSGSLRHEGKSIGYILGQYVGEQGKDLLLWFAFLTIILVLAVFALVVGIVFDAYPSAATASLIYIALALVFGVYLYQFDLPFIPGTVAFVAAVFAGVWLGIQFPITLASSSADAAVPLGLPMIINPNVSLWVPIIIIYAYVASVLPVWMLLQPRDYLSSFLLYAGVGGVLLAIIVGTVFGNWLGLDALAASQPLTVQLNAYEGFMGVKGAFSPLFPLLFVTIACGTISGFHSLVSSGTTAKQLDSEADARLIGYGGMLGEGLLATVSLATLAVSAASLDPAGGIGVALPNFATGGGIILTAFGIPESFGAPFMALVLTSFLLTSTDTAVRLGRYMGEEIVGTPEASWEPALHNRYVNPGVQGILGYLLVASGSWLTLWQLFGGANQLLAALALLTATVWLANWDDTKQLLSTGIPMFIMVTITTLALLWLALYSNLYAKFIAGDILASGSFVSIASAVVQIVLAFVLIGIAWTLVSKAYGNIEDARGGLDRESLTGGGASPPQDD